MRRPRRSAASQQPIAGARRVRRRTPRRPSPGHLLLTWDDGAREDCVASVPGFGSGCSAGWCSSVPLFCGVRDSRSGEDPFPSGTESLTAPTPCESVGSLDRLVVRRTDAFPQNGVRFSFPAVVTVSSVTSVRAVASALCKLPRMPRGTFACPADFGISYDLTFSGRDRSFPAATVDATGCQVVRGLPHALSAATSLGFWRILGQAMGLATPGQQSFRGSLPS